MAMEQNMRKNLPNGDTDDKKKLTGFILNVKKKKLPLVLLLGMLHHNSHQQAHISDSCIIN